MISVMPIAPQLQVIRSGLVLLLDALIQTSYAGSGATWNDISGNGINASVTNSTFSNNAINLVNDNTAIILNNSSLNVQTGDHTIQFWVRVNSFSNYNDRIFQTVNGDLFTSYSMSIDSNIIKLWMSSNGTSFNLLSARNIQSVTLGVYYFITLKRSGSTFTFHVNNGAGTNYLTSSSNLRNSNVMYYGGQVTATNRTCKSSWGSILFYNRALSQEEVNHNFNTQRVRFGV